MGNGRQLFERATFPHGRVVIIGGWVRASFDRPDRASSSLREFEIIAEAGGHGSLLSAGPYLRAARRHRAAGGLLVPLCDHCPCVYDGPRVFRRSTEHGF